MADPKVDLKQLIRNEFKKCAIDPIYFIRKYCVIQHPTRGRLPFDLYPYQEEAIRDFARHDYNIFLKGRQIGISTVVACFSLWLMLFHRDKNIMVVATKQDTARTMIKKVQYAYDHLPLWLQVKSTSNNKLSIEFVNGSSMKASSAASDTGRSEALSLLILDEAAHIKNAEDIWVAALPTLSTGGKAVLISTPAGVGNFFHQTYVNATTGVVTKANDNEIRFHPTKLDWKVHPDRDQQWRDKMGSIQGERAARQEYDADFIGSGNTVVDAELIEFFATLTTDPLYKVGFDGNVWIWEEPDFSKEYVVCADTARGDGEDFSTYQVLDVKELRQVAEYKGMVGTSDFGNMLVEIATKYNDALLVIERENTGWAVIQRVIDRQYRNLFYMSKDHKVVDVEHNVSNRFYAEESRMVAGFTTSLKTRPLLINKLDTYMREEGAVQIRSMRLIEELRVFIWENHKAVAMKGCHDDLVMAFCIGLWVRDTALRMQMEGNLSTIAALDSIKKVGSDLVYTGRNDMPDPYIIPMGNSQQPDENIRWLLS